MKPQLNDEYDHIDSSIIYITENIPGPVAVDDQQSLEITNKFNSQITQHCVCLSTCELPECLCLKMSLVQNYIRLVNGDKLVLNESKSHQVVLECNSLCTCLQNCGNRLVQFGPLEDLKIREIGNSIDNSKGYGLLTDKFIPKGTFICEYAGELISKQQALIRHKYNKDNKKMNYIFCLNEHSNNEVMQTIVDPSQFGNVGRYINHSCEPNCKIIPVYIDSPFPKLGIFALQNIYVGSEITFDYGPHEVKTSSFRSIDSNRVNCLCKSKNCRQWLPYHEYT